MPLPERRPNEPHDEFRDRCMKDPVMVKEFPDIDQRRAVCERQAKLKGDGYLNLVSEPGALTIEAVGEDEQTTNGKPKLPRFSMAAYTGGPMRIAGWRYPVIVDLAGLSIPSHSRPIRFCHDMASGVGHTDAIKIEGGKLLATGLVSRDTAAAKEVVASARNGFPWQASITAAIEEFEFVKDNQRVTVNGREYSGPVNVVRKATLGEISFVDLGAEGQTFARVAATASQFQEEKTQMDENVSTNTQTAEKETAEANQAADSATATENKPAGTLEAQNAGPTAADSRAALPAARFIQDPGFDCNGQVRRPNADVLPLRLGSPLFRPGAPAHTARRRYRRHSSRASRPMANKAKVPGSGTAAEPRPPPAPKGQLTTG